MTGAKNPFAAGMLVGLLLGLVLGAGLSLGWAVSRAAVITGPVEERGGVILGNVYVPQFPGWREIHRSPNGVDVACVSGAVLSLTRTSKANASAKSLRFENVPLLIQKNRSGAEVFYHIVPSGTAITVEGYIVTDETTTMFFGQSPIGDRPSLSEIERMLSESKSVI